MHEPPRCTGVRAPAYPRGILAVPLAAALLLGGGCASSGPAILDLMPAPAAYEHEVAPFGDVDGAGVDAAPLDMLYVTNRARAGDADDARFYSGERGYLLRAGAARIAFGDSDITWDEARQIALLKNRPGNFPLHVESVAEYGVLPESVSLFTPLVEAAAVDPAAADGFRDAVEQRLARTAAKDIFIYVHGYKVDFENPLLVASELWHFLGHEGAFIAFSWPSTPKRLAYMKDIETARVSAWGLRKLISFLARETSARRIHIVGYSAGTRVVLTALYELALLHHDSSEAEIRAATRLGRVVLVGSDVDTGTFASYVLDGLLRVQEDLNLYVSPADQALHISERVFAHRRLGEVLPGTLDARMREFAAHEERLAFIDVENAANFDAGNGHAYFRKSPWVSSDVLMGLRYGLDPRERGLQRSPESPIWRFPADYLMRFESALAAVDPRFESGAAAAPPARPPATP
ncbi:MAG: alpha/beta hydrolase [Gammaproteobacteria bacterium]